MKQTNPYNKLSVLLLSLVALLYIGSAETKGGLSVPSTPLSGKREAGKPIDTLRTEVSFIIDSLLIIKDNSHHLKPVLNTFKELEAGKDTVLTIVHLGDSHVQAGY